MDDEFLDFLNKAPWVLDIKWPTRFLNTVHLTLFMILVWENQRSRASWWAWLGFSYTRRFILAGHAPEDDSVDKTTIV
ncbi:hypothetical protein MIMGU_mgv1a017397mg [Erythranthe guttata]|uniref:Uncharacterized protein n=2 Tax=Erythranthe guttata TaxID=4155 RepID=A0A022QYQ7_ERYGU|nr:hypothetical protein MIMGU_mgv1a017397mg [Erythranthe guttata]